MQFQKGQSGNPAGRPRGSRNRTTILMQALLADRAEAIGRKVIQLAEDGDMAAIRLCMDRLAPAPKDEPVDIELPPLESLLTASLRQQRSWRGSRPATSRPPRQGSWPK